MRQKPPPLTEEQRAAINAERQANGLDPLTDAPHPDDVAPAGWRDAPIPKTKEQLEEVISQGVARMLELATKPKELTDAVKVATEWYATRYGKGEQEWGSGLKGGAVNGHSG